MPSSDTFTFMVCPLDTVNSLKEKIELLTSIPVKEQRMTYNGKQLQLETKLTDYDIVD